jgi:ABC-type glycerol-3-phosphate transport system substrate-binding protein
MQREQRTVVWRLITVLCGLALLSYGAPAAAQSIDEVYKAALKEGGTLNFYGTLAQINAARILPVFEKRFPGIKINHVDATADKLAARAITEARGGRVIADIFQMSLENILQLAEQKLVLDRLPPESSAYPANLKGPFWLAADLIIITAAWNSNLVKKRPVERQADRRAARRGAFDGARAPQVQER